MVSSLIATKQGQTQTFDQNGQRVPVTLLSVGPCHIVQIKTAEKDGYFALQLGLGTKQQNAIKKPQRGHYTKAGLTKKEPRFLREIYTDESAIEGLAPGTRLLVSDILYPGDEVTVTGTSKGKGFTGVVKRWKFAGGPKTHGQSDRHRAPGSIGAGTTPGRVLKGKRMAGRSGSETITIKGLHVISVDAPHETVTISGVIPGSVGTLITITKTKEAPREKAVDDTKVDTAVAKEEKQVTGKQEPAMDQQESQKETEDKTPEEPVKDLSDNHGDENKKTSKE